MQISGENGRQVGEVILINNTQQGKRVSSICFVVVA
jgi:hypothetical protein